MTRPSGWPPILVNGLACVAAALGVALATRAAWQAQPMEPPPPIVAPRPSPPTLEGPAMRIDPADLKLAGRERSDNALGMPFRWCPPGAFHMGRLPEPLRRFQSATPTPARIEHGYWMGQHEVTQAQWQRVMNASLREQRAKDPLQPRPLGDGSTRDHVGEGPEHPIYFVSHAEAEAFCQTLTESERADGRLEEGWEYRLPTEAQWEFACRAGTTTATAFGDSLTSTQANFDGTQPLGDAPPGPYLHETTPVGRYPPNAWGLHDMHGNLWEWCHQDDDAPPPSSPVNEATALKRFYRGGCWHNPSSLVLSTAQGWGSRDGRGSGLGFRVALVHTGP